MIEIIDFLKSHKGYLKWGNQKLADKFNVSLEDIIEAKKIIREELNEDLNSLESSGDNLSIAQIWEKPDGSKTVHYKAKKEDDLGNILSGLGDDIAKSIKNIKRPDVEFKEEDGMLVAVMSLPDVHIGEYDGENSLEDQIERFKGIVYELFDKILSYNVKHIIFPIGSDYFNVDNSRNSTTKGTLQDVNSFWQEMYREGLLALIEVIEYMSQKVMITIPVIYGNHDHMLSFVAGEAINVAFYNNPMVNVDNEIDKSRKYYQFGKNLFGFTHGDKEKRDSLPLLMAQEAKEMWGDTDYKDFFIGHLHHQDTKDFFGVKVIGLPTLTSRSSWAKASGYLSRRGVHVHIYDFINGPKVIIQENLI